MPPVQPDKIRNVVVVGHGGSGKTSLVESLLHAVGATTRLGKVDDATSILDTAPEEQKRHITINMALAAFTHEGVTINLIDTPGYADFAADPRAGMRVAAAAVVSLGASARRRRRAAHRDPRDASLARRGGLPHRQVTVRRRDRAQARSRREALGFRVQDDRRPLRRKALVRPRVLGDASLEYVDLRR